MERLLNAIALEIKVSGKNAVGIVVDANDSLIKRWSSVSKKLRDAGIVVPKTPDSQGTIIEASGSLPKVGVWLMPNNESRGELEHFVQEMIDPDDPVWPKSCSYIDNIPEKDRKFRESKEMKAKVYAWLSTQETPGLMGPIIGSGQLSCDGPLCNRFTSWINRLFKN